MNPAEKIARLSPREWLISITAHAIIFGLLIYLIPARELATLFTKDKAMVPPPKEAYQDPSQVREVVKDIAREQAAAAREHVAELADLEKRLNALTKDRLDAYANQVKSVAANAARNTLEQLQKIPMQQDATLQAQDQLAQRLLQLSSAPPPADDPSMQALRHELDGLQQQVGESHSTTEDEQEKATQLLHFVAQDSPQDDAQKKANDAEIAATLSQQETTGSQYRLLDNLNQQVRQSVAVKRTTDVQATLSSQLAQETQVGTQAQAAFDAAKTAADAANATYQQAAAVARTTKTPADQQSAAADRQAFIQAQKTFAQARTDQNQHSWKLKNLQNQLTEWQKNQVTASTRLASVQANFAPLQAQMQMDLAKARADEATAKQAQLDSITQLASMANNPPQSVAQTAPADAAVDTPIPDASSLPEKNLGQLYETARQLENQITDKYKTYRAAELASIQKLTLADAMQDTKVARPNREQLNVPLLSAQGATQNFDGYKSEVNKANQQMQSMVALSSDMVSIAEAQKNVGLGDVQLQQDHYDQMVASATADENAAGKDLTGATGGNGAGEAETGPQQGAGGMGGPALSTDSSVLPTKEYARTAPELPAMDYAHLKPIATRRISEDGPHHADWLYVDSWYFIGPFENEGRRNLYTKFPPESIIDLDAVYNGKNGRPLHWVYTQWNSPMLRPDNDVADAPAIYYAYTELIFDKAEDLWIASGSDDKGTMWLNDVIVWNSSDILKGWTPNEGYRKVHFNQGRNRILYRLENGQLAADFSLMISTQQN